MKDTQESIIYSPEIFPLNPTVLIYDSLLNPVVEPSDSVNRFPARRARAELLGFGVARGGTGEADNLDEHSDL